EQRSEAHTGAREVGAAGAVGRGVLGGAVVDGGDGGAVVLSGVIALVVAVARGRGGGVVPVACGRGGGVVAAVGRGRGGRVVVLVGRGRGGRVVVLVGAAHVLRCAARGPGEGADLGDDLGAGLRDRGDGQRHHGALGDAQPVGEGDVGEQAARVLDVGVGRLEGAVLAGVDDHGLDLGGA